MKQGRFRPIDTAGETSSEIEHVVREAREAFSGSPLEGLEGRVINRFEDPVWDLGHLLPPVRSSGTRRLYFTRKGSTTEPLPHIVGDAFRAFIVYKHQSVRSVPALAGILLVLRKLWEVMQDRRPALRQRGEAGFRWATFAAADLAALEKEVKGDLILYAREFASFLQAPHRRVIPVWTYRPTPSTRNRHRRGTPEERAEWRRSRLPYREALLALADYYWQTRPEGAIDRSDRELLEDRLMICVTVILLCTGVRVTECATLPVNCLEHTYEGGEISYFLRYGILKRRQRDAHHVRRLSPQQAHLVTMAYREILEITEPWRMLARDLERHADRVVIRDRDGRIRDDNELVDSREATRLLGLRGGLATHRPELVPAVPARGSMRAKYRIGDVARVIQRDRERMGLATVVARGRGSREPQRLSESLLVVPVYFLSRRSEHHPVLVKLLSPQTIAGWLSGAARYRSIFEKLRPVTGRQLRIRTHQFRHLLHYHARKRGLSDALLAVWMGRADPRKNEDYTHDASTDVAAAALRERIRRGEVDGPFVDHLRALPSAVREAVLEAEVQAAHETSIGLCKANFMYDPCRFFGGCLNRCKHLLVERGNQGQLIQIRRMRERNEAQLRLFDELVAAGEDLEPAHRERLLTVIEGCRDAERRIRSGVPDGRLVPVFPDGEDRFVPLETEES